MKDKVILGLKIVFILVIVLWIGIVLVDYFNARNVKDPMFCLSQEIKVYNESGKLTKTMSKADFDKLSDNERDELSYTLVCTGLGYKVYRYHREFSAIEFGPFFIKERQQAN